MRSNDLPDAMVAVSRCRTVRDVVEALAAAIAVCPHVALVQVWLLGPEGGDTLRPPAIAPADSVRRYRLSAGAGNTVWRDQPVTRPGQHVSAGADGGQWRVDAEFIEHEKIRTVVTQPIGMVEELGVLLILDRTELTDADRWGLKTFANLVAVALANARAFEDGEALRARLSEEIQNLREEFRDLFEEAPIAYVHEGLDSRFIRANRAALRILGLAPADVTSTFGRDLVANTTDTQGRLQAAFESVERGDEAKDVVLELRRKNDGRPVWVQWSSRPSPDGRYTRTMMVDITDRVLVEKTKAALEFSLETGQVGDWDLDLLTDTSRRSLRHDRCFGYDKPIPESKWNVGEFIRHVFPADRERVESGIRSAIEELRHWHAEFRIVWPDRSIHWLVARGRVYGAAGEKATRMLGIVMDITERKHAEETLRETKAALEFALESAHVGDWDLDLIHDTSRRSLRHDQCFGYSQPIPEADWGIDVFVSHVHPDDQARVDASLRGAAESQRDFDAEFRVNWGDGSLHWLIARGKTYRTSEGRASRMLGVVMDITERKRAEEALIASEKLALGHVEALTRTLDAMASESAPDRLAEHVLRTVADQLEAHSCSVWQREEENPLFAFECGIECNQFVSKSSTDLGAASLVLPAEGNWPWLEAFRTGKHAVMEDIGAMPFFPWQARRVAQGVVTILIIPMMIAGSVRGLLGVRFGSHRRFAKEEIALAQALANQATLALQLTRLSTRSRMSAVIAERNRMARDIHDTLAQGFTGVIIQLEAAADAGSKGLSSEADTHVERAKELARESLREARRSVRALRPQELERNELSEALEVLVRKTTAGTQVSAEFSLQGRPRRLPEAWDANLLRIVQEVLTNVLRHAGASHFTARIAFAEDQVHLKLADDGKGFDPECKNDGFGLLGIGERVREMGGTLTIDTRPAAGVVMTIALPLVADLQYASP